MSGVDEVVVGPFGLFPREEQCLLSLRTEIRKRYIFSGGASLGRGFFVRLRHIQYTRLAFAAFSTWKSWIPAHTPRCRRCVRRVPRRTFPIARTCRPNRSTDRTRGL